MRRWLALFVIVTGCAHQAPKEAPAFPFGTYHHQVTVEPRGQPPAHLQGVVRSGPDEWRLSALSTAGTTLFRIENRNGETSLENFASAIPDTEIRRINAWIQRAMRAPLSRTEFTYDDAQFAIASPDGRGVPRWIRIIHPRAEIKVEVLEYQPR